MALVSPPISISPSLSHLVITSLWLPYFALAALGGGFAWSQIGLRLSSFTSHHGSSSLFNLFYFSPNFDGNILLSGSVSSHPFPIFTCHYLIHKPLFMRLLTFVLQSFQLPPGFGLGGGTFMIFHVVPRFHVPPRFEKVPIFVGGGGFFCLFLKHILIYLPIRWRCSPFRGGGFFSFISQTP